MFKPLNGRILVQPEESELQKKANSAGLVLSTNADKEKPVTGVVIVGNEELATGTRILFSKFAFDEVEVKGEKYYVVSTPNVLGIFD